MADTRNGSNPALEEAAVNSRDMKDPSLGKEVDPGKSTCTKNEEKNNGQGEESSHLQTSSSGAGSNSELQGATTNSVDKKQSSHPVVVMRVDPPDNNPPEKEELNCDHDGVKPYSPSARIFPPNRPGNPILGSSRFTSTFGSNSLAPKLSAFGASKGAWGSALASSPKPVLLRPSQLAVGNTEPQQAGARCLFPTNPFGSKNPFAKVSTSPEKAIAPDTSKPKGLELRPAASKSDDALSSEKANLRTEKEEGKESANSTQTLPDSRGSNLLATPKFVPLGSPATHKDESSSSGAASSAVPSAVTGFVFGQNLHERVAEAVTLENTVSSSSKAVEAGGTLNNVASSATTNGTSEMLFTSVIRKDQHNDSSGSDTGERPSKSLSEAAREYEEARAVKRKYEEVAVVTGEEGEVNVLQINCKLFAFDKATSSWQERGRGTLRLNDKDGPGGNQSRVVIRTSGSLRVVLNTKIWAGMMIDKPSSKSVRLTALDSTGQIKVFLVMASPKETDHLHRALQTRLASQRQATEGTGAVEVEGDLSSRSLPPEPVLKKRPSQVQDTGGGDASQM